MSTTMAARAEACHSQVSSLTQFYSVDFSQSRIDVGKRAGSQSRFASAVVDGDLGPPRIARQT